MSQRQRSQPRASVPPQTTNNQSNNPAPAALTARAINSGVDALLGLQEKRQAKRMKYSSTRRNDDDDDTDSPSPILDGFIQTRGAPVVKELTNFSMAEFNLLWSEVRSHIAKSWNVGSGRKSRTSPRDMLFMTLTVLKHGCSWDIMASLFKYNASTLSKSIIGFVTALHPFLMHRYVRSLSEKWTMLRLSTTGNQFGHFPCARYAVDVTFQQTHAPAGSFAAKKAFFSKKHGLYGLKVEVSVMPNGLAIGVSPSAKGSVSDITIFDNNEAFHRYMLLKLHDERNMFDDGPLHEQYPDQWALLADKGYQGLQEKLRAITPSKRPPGGILTASDEERNDRIATDRVIVENFFGRMKTLWAVASDLYSWSRSNYDMFIQTCVALTNVHVRFLPLRASDGVEHIQYVNRLLAIGTRKVEKRAATMKRYVKKRKERIEVIIPSLDGTFYDDDSDTAFNADESGIFD